MRIPKKRDFPVAEIRRFLEPGPVVLVSSAWRGETNIMTMGWHTVMEFSPSLVGCVISERNHSFELVRRSRECVINVPTVDMATQVARIGTCSGAMPTWNAGWPMRASCGPTTSSSSKW
jgi:flavin reductase (DIM6/NTAB) family NADH-FMN oxidoreductase RutF